MERWRNGLLERCFSQRRGPRSAFGQARRLTRNFGPTRLPVQGQAPNLSCPTNCLYLANFSRSLEERRLRSPTRFPEPPSALLREEEFSKQLRLARYLAGSRLPPSRPLEPAIEARTPKQGTRKEARSVTKARGQSQAELNSCAIQPSIAANEPEKPRSSVQSVIIVTDG